MVYLRLLLIKLLLITNVLFAQSINGKVVDQQGIGLSDLQVQLYFGSDVYSTSTLMNGSFTFDNVTDIKDVSVPTNYYISQNFPNPFNPKTRFLIGLPNSSNVKVEVFNLLGQKVLSDYEKFYSSGNHSIDIEMNGLSNGMYVVRISFDNKHSFVKKVMLLYGSQHLSASSEVNTLQKGSGELKFTLTEIDSLVIEGDYILKKIFKELPSFDGSLLDLGDLVVERDTTVILYGGEYYHTVRIGEQTWIKENLNVGSMIISNSPEDNQLDNGIVEKYCYDNDSLNCNKFGGLYQWREAMQYITQEGSQGICPKGWHIPTYAEFEAIKSFVNNDGNALKAIGQGTGDGAGTNASGFSGLLAGIKGSDGFTGLNSWVHFWSSTEGDVTNYNAVTMALEEDNSIIDVGHHSLSWGTPIRCIKDALLPEIPLLVFPKDLATIDTISIELRWISSNPLEYYQLQLSPSDTFEILAKDISQITDTSIHLDSLEFSTRYYWRVRAFNSFGTSDWSNTWSFTTPKKSFACGDSLFYEGKYYHTVQIGDQCWLRENLNIGTMINYTRYPKMQSDNELVEKYCYNNDLNNCNKYGGLYQWDEAMQYTLTESVQGICPEGWHIPNKNEYLSLLIHEGNMVNEGTYSGSNRLKAVNQGTGDGVGTDESGFSLLLAGEVSRVSKFNALNHLGKLHTSSNTNLSFSSEHDWVSILDWDINNDFARTSGLSIRCLRGTGAQKINIPPDVPSLLFPNENDTLSSSLLRLKWECSDPDNNQLEYTIYLGSPNNMQPIVIDYKSNSYIFRDLLPSTQYSWKIVVTDGEYLTSSQTNTFFTGPDKRCSREPIINYMDRLYSTVQIGNQCWMAENLDAGEFIYSNEDPIDNEIVEKFCLYDQEESCLEYGGLYSWSEAMDYSTSTITSGICPDGWRLPTKEDFEILKENNNNNASSLLYQDQGREDFYLGNNKSGFSALFAGYLYDSTYTPIDYSMLLSTTRSDVDDVFSLLLWNISEYINVKTSNARAYSIRCIREEVFNTEASDTIGTDGGRVEVGEIGSPLNGCFVDIPSGALTSTNIISIAIPEQSLEFEGDTTGTFVELLPNGLEFNQPIEIGIPIPQSMDPDSTRIYVYDNDEHLWDILPIKRIDPENNILVVSTTHFSTYTIRESGIKFYYDLYKTKNNYIALYFDLKTSLDKIKPYLITVIGSNVVSMKQYLEKYPTSFYAHYRVKLYKKGFIIDEMVDYKNLIWHPNVDYGNRFEVQCLIHNKEIQNQGNWDEFYSTDQKFLTIDKVEEYASNKPIIVEFNDYVPDSDAEYYIKIELYYRDQLSFANYLLADGTSMMSDYNPTKYSELVYPSFDINNNQIVDVYEDISLQAPTLSVPQNNSVGLNNPLSFNWSPVSDAVKYIHQVSAVQDFSVVREKETTTNSISRDDLVQSTKYYWRVKAVNNYAESDWSDVWTFTMQGTSNNPPLSPSNPSPADGATNISLNTSFSWSCSDPDGDNLTYDMYFGTIENPPLVSSGLSSNSYIPNSLAYNTMYYWKVVAKDNNGGITEGSVWNFTTETGGPGGTPCPGLPTITYAGKTYNTVLIGDQCWLKENLDVGNMIQGNVNMSDNGTIEKYCYDNNTTNCEIYGGLYEWDEAMQYVTIGGTQGICPSGWHIPSKSEFDVLNTMVNMNGNALKAIGQGSGDGAGTNTSGFSALLAGYRTSNNTFVFQDLNYHTTFWSSGDLGLWGAYYESLVGPTNELGLPFGNKDGGSSIRCIKD